MKKAIYYFYYRLFDMHSRGEEIALGAFMAVITISIILWLNLFTIIAFLRKINLIHIFFSKTGSIILGLSIITIDYFLFMHKKKYEGIIQMFKDESRNKKIKGGLLVLLYILLSVVAFIIMVLYKPGQL